METTKDLRNKVLTYINSADDKLLKMIQALVETYQNDDEFVMTEEQKRELDRRLERLENGDTKFFSWEEVKERLKLEK